MEELLEMIKTILKSFGIALIDIVLGAGALLSFLVSFIVIKENLISATNEKIMLVLFFGFLFSIAIVIGAEMRKSAVVFFKLIFRRKK
jgi:hypothetical protein